MKLQSSSSTLDPRVRWLWRLVVLVAVLMRLTYLLEVTDAPDFAAPRFESQYHDYWARALVSGDWTPPQGVTDPEIQQRPYFRPPGYPYFLAAVYGLLGSGYLMPRLVQMALGLSTCWLLFGLGRRVYGDVAGLAAAALMATYWVSLYFEAELMAPSLLLWMLVVWISIMERTQRRWTWPLIALSGLWLGLTALVRPNVLILAAPACLWWVWLRWPLGGRERRRLLLSIGLFTAAVLMAVLPATWRNLRVADDPVLVTSNAGINLFVGNHPDSDGYTPGVPELGRLLGDSGWDSFDQPKICAAVSAEVGRPLKDSEVSRYFSRRALDYMLSEPLAVMRLWGHKLLLFFGPAEISNTKVLTMERRYSPTLGLGIEFATVLALALWGLGLEAWRRRSAQPLEPPSTSPQGDAPHLYGHRFTVLVLLCSVAYTASYLPFFVSARFRLPIVTWWMLLAGAGIGIGWRWLRRGDWRKLLVALLLFAVLRTLTGVPWVSYTPDEALWHSRRGLLFQQAEQTDRAIESFELALAVDGDRPQVLLPLADTLVTAERYDDAVAVYRRALHLDPTNIAGHNNLAMVLVRRGDTAAALDHWRTILRLDPGRLSALVNLAGTLATSQDPTIRNPREALELAQRAAALTDGRDPRVQAVLTAAQRAVADAADDDLEQKP